MNDKKIKKMIIAALLAALTCIATMIIKFPTPTFGYIHLGDCFVLLCGILLGPQTGALAAGIGSMFADVFSGYVSWAPATLIIKALTAGIAGFLFRRLQTAFKHSARHFIPIVIGGLAGEIVMVAGYFFYEAVFAAVASGGITSATLTAGIVSAASGIPFNIVQGVTGIILSVLLVPVLQSISSIRERALQ